MFNTDDTSFTPLVKTIFPSGSKMVTLPVYCFGMGEFLNHLILRFALSIEFIYSLADKKASATSSPSLKTTAAAM
jgi:hypothetical protein